jgi:hypothetical protein
MTKEIKRIKVKTITWHREKDGSIVVGCSNRDNPKDVFYLVFDKKAFDWMGIKELKNMIVKERDN